MYFQIIVAEERRCLVKFLWWRDGNIWDEPIVYEMCVHVFGSVSSGGCSNYVLRRTAIENKHIYGEEAAETLRNNFYVDELLKSVEDEDSAIHLIKKVRSMCLEGGFNLTKFCSNSKRVLLSILEEYRKASIKNQDLLGSLLEELVLGVLWKTEADLLEFKVSIKDKPTTRRGILSILSSIYDPLGFETQFLLRGKQILQKLCEKNQKWDTKLPEDLQTEREKWKIKLLALQEMHIKRCFDANACGSCYGQASYLRRVDEKG